MKKYDILAYGLMIAGLGLWAFGTINMGRVLEATR